MLTVTCWCVLVSVLKKSWIYLFWFSHIIFISFQGDRVWLLGLHFCDACCCYVRIPLVHDSDSVAGECIDEVYAFSCIAMVNPMFQLFCFFDAPRLMVSFFMCMWILMFQERHLRYVSFALFLNINSDNRRVVQAF